MIQLQFIMSNKAEEATPQQRRPFDNRILDDDYMETGRKCTCVYKAVCSYFNRHPCRFPILPSHHVYRFFTNRPPPAEAVTRSALPPLRLIPTAPPSLPQSGPLPRPQAPPPGPPPPGPSPPRPPPPRPPPPAEVPQEEEREEDKREDAHCRRGRAPR